MKLRGYVDALQAVTAKRCPRAIKEKRGADGSTISRTPLPWNVLDARETETGFDIALHVPLGYSAADLMQELDAIAASFGRYVNIRDRGGVVVVSVSKQDFPEKIPFDLSMLEATKGRRVLCGYDQLGRPVVHDFRVPHVLVGAQSGYGKTDLLRFWLLQLISRFTPAQLHIDIIDGKGFSFKPFRGVPHVRTIARDLASAAHVLKEARADMERRSVAVWESDDDRGQVTGGFRWRLVVVDEMYVLAPYAQVTKAARQLATEAYANMAAISCVGREAGVGCIMATQRPDVNTIHPQVKQNCDVSIALKCKTRTNSEIVIDRPGAEMLPHKVPGRAIYAGQTDTVFQVPYVGDDDRYTQLLAPYKTPWKDDANDERKPPECDLNDIQ